MISKGHIHPNVRRIILATMVARQKALRVALKNERNRRYCLSQGATVHATTCRFIIASCKTQYRAARRVWYAAFNGHHIPLKDIQLAI